MFGGPLVGGALVRLIYADEAGTSSHEPVRVVAAIVVHGDHQWRVLAEEIERLFDEHVPQSIRKGFVFHATEVFNGGKKVDRKTWPLEDRLQFMSELLCLPFVHDVPIALGICFKGVFKEATDPVVDRIGRDTLEHVTALSTCIERADYFLRRYLKGTENGTVVAEHVSQKKKMLAAAALYFKHQPSVIGSDDQRPERWQKLAGVVPRPQVNEIKHIVDVPHFVAKGHAPLLQLADACAFTFRRCLAKQPHGDDLLCAMLGHRQGLTFLRDDVWFSGTSSGLFNQQAYFCDVSTAQSAAR